MTPRAGIGGGFAGTKGAAGFETFPMAVQAFGCIGADARAAEAAADSPAPAGAPRASQTRPAAL